MQHNKQNKNANIFDLLKLEKKNKKGIKNHQFNNNLTFILDKKEYLNLHKTIFKNGGSFIITYHVHFGSTFFLQKSIQITTNSK